MSEFEQIEKQMKARLAELLERAGAVEEELRSPLDPDFSEQAVDLADDESLAGVDEVLHSEIRDIRQALLRIERDEYGVCTSCGADIGGPRLQVLPTATKCIACASRD